MKCGKCDTKRGSETQNHPIPEYQGEALCADCLDKLTSCCCGGPVDDDGRCVICSRLPDDTYHDDLTPICDAIIAEFDRAETIHPDWPADIIHQSAILAEEAGELVRACLNHVYHGGSMEDVKTEAVQVGAMAVRFLKEVE